MPAERFERLRTWLLQLVELLMAAGGPVRDRLVQAVAGKRAVVQLDDVIVELQAERVPEGLRVTILPADEREQHHFRSTGDTLRDVIDGRALLDSVIVDGRMEVRASLQELIAVHDVVMLALALGPRSRALRELWREFCDWWPRAAVDCRPLDRQRPRHGLLHGSVPLEVLLVGSTPPS